MSDPSSGTGTNTQLQLYADNGLQLQTQIAMPGFANAGRSYVSHGRYVFWNAAASRLFAIIEADSSSGLLSPDAVYTVNAPEASPVCTYALSSSSISLPVSGASNFLINVTTNCNWKAISSDNWLSLSNFGPSTGNGQIILYVPSNSGGPRSSSIVVGNQTVFVTQAGSQIVPIIQTTTATAGNFRLDQGAAATFGSFTLLMQGDGNLVLYRQDGMVLWSTATYGQNCGTNQCYALFQGDGDLVVYNGATALWHSGTYGNPGATLLLSGQSPQLEIFDKNQSIIWTNVYAFSPGDFTLSQGEVFEFGALQLAMQGDGNLVLYQANGTPIWSTGTYGQNCAGHCFAVFRGDGNLVVYNGATALWQSGTDGNPAAQLVFSAQSPQIEVIGSNQSILWANASAFGAGNFRLTQGQIFEFGSLMLAMQGDGNLVLYQPNGTPLWSTGTYGQNCSAGQCYAVFQGDGNLVVYNGSKPLWQSGTYGNPAAQLVFSSQSPQLQVIGSHQSILWANASAFTAGTFKLTQGQIFQFSSLMLAMQGDGNLVLYQANGTPLWNTGTYGQNCTAGQCFAVFQGDGNLVVYNGSTAIWSSQTNGNPGSKLVFSPQAPQVAVVGSNQSNLWVDK